MKRMTAKQARALIGKRVYGDEIGPRVKFERTAVFREVIGLNVITEDGSYLWLPSLPPITRVEEQAA